MKDELNYYVWVKRSRTLPKPYGHVNSPKSSKVADMMKETLALDIFPIVPCRLQFTVTQIVSGFLQSITTFPSVGCVGSGPGKSVVIFTDLNPLYDSSDVDAVLLSVVSSNFSVVYENSDEVVSLKSICSVVFAGSELLTKRKDFSLLTETVSDLLHEMCVPSFDT